MQVSFLTVSSKQKNKIEPMEYHGIVTYHSKVGCTKSMSPIILLFRSWSLILYLHVWVKAKFFLKMVNELNAILMGFMPYLKNILAVSMKS